jgi:hypothetical protein
VNLAADGGKLWQRSAAWRTQPEGYSRFYVERRSEVVNFRTVAFPLAIKLP